jgi:O-antigen/teichoic acid export membrane protein
MAALSRADADISDAGVTPMAGGFPYSWRDPAMTGPSPTSAGTLMTATPGRLSAAWATAQRWKGRIFFAFADQGLFSASNFVLTIVYATWLPIGDFGRYVVVWTASLFIEAIQTSLVIDALPAITARYGRRNRQRIDSAALWVVVAFSLGSSLILIGAATVLAELLPNYAWPILVLALVNPLQRLYLFFRRLCYIRDQQSAAATAALAYCLASFGGALALAYFHAFSVGAVIALSGLGSAAAIIVVMAMSVGKLSKSRPLDVAWLALQIWSSSRWLAPAAVVSWLITWGIFPIVAAISGPAAAGIIRALQNLLTPIVQFNAALNLVILPRVADKVADDGDAYARRFALRGTAVFATTALIYCALIMATAHFTLPLIYKKPEIAASAFLLWPLSLAIVCEAARAASSMSLLATRRTRTVFFARLVALAAFASASAVLGYFMGYVGIMWANAFGTAAGSIVVVSAAMMRPAPKPAL